MVELATARKKEKNGKGPKGEGVKCAHHENGREGADAGAGEDSTEREKLANKFRHHPIYRLSLGQFGLGVTAVLAQLAITFFNDVHLDLYTLNEGLLCGASFAVTGLLGISAARWLSPRMGTIFLLASALAAILAVLLLTFSCAHLAEILWYQETDDYAASGFPLLKSLLSLQIVVSTVELCFALSCVALSTKTCCSTFTRRSSGEAKAMEEWPTFRSNSLKNSHKYPSLSIKLLSSLQIFIGSLCLFLFVVLFSLSFDARHSLTFEEIYCGLLFIGIGLFGFYTVKHLAVTSLTPYMLLNIFGCLFAGLLVTLALIRIYMFDKMQEKGLAYRREDLRFLPTLNCTRDVLEDIVDLSAVDYTKRHTTPSPEDVERSIRNCERLREEELRDARTVLGRGAEMGGPRKVYQLEIGLAVLECIAALICATLSARACCCCCLPSDDDDEGTRRLTNGYHAAEESEEEAPAAHAYRNGDRQRGGYNEYRK